jgi:hypothetical protein
LPLQLFNARQDQIRFLGVHVTSPQFLSGAFTY